MTHIGLQELRVKWIRWYAVSVFIGVTLGSCQVGPDVVFEKPDNSKDAGSEAEIDADSDSETMMLDSGSNILDSELNDQDSTTPGPEGGNDIVTSWAFPPACVDEEKAYPIDVCTYDSPSEEYPLLDPIYGRIINSPVDSEDDCIRLEDINKLSDDIKELPLFSDNFGEFPLFQFLQPLFESEFSVEDFETTSDHPRYGEPCPQICEAGSKNEVVKLLMIAYLAKYYYVDPNSENIRRACPLACEMLRCWIPLSLYFPLPDTNG